MGEEIRNVERVKGKNQQDRLYTIHDSHWDKTLNFDWIVYILFKYFLRRVCS